MPRRFVLAAVALGLWFAPLLAFAQSPVPESVVRFQALPFREFLDVSYREWLLRDPERVTHLGLSEIFGIRNDRLTDLSAAYAAESKLLLEEILSALQAYDRQALCDADQLSYDLYEWLLKDELQEIRFRNHDYLLTSFFYSSEEWKLQDFLQTTHPLQSMEDVDDLVERLGQVRWKVGQLIDELWAREALGIVAPRFMLERSIRQLKTWLGISAAIDVEDIPAEDTSLHEALSERLRNCSWMTIDEQQEAIDRVLRQIRGSYVPAYYDLLVAAEELLEIAPEQGGATVLPDGEAYLAHAISHHVTTDIAPDELMKIGLAEVERIQAAICKIAAEMGYSCEITVVGLLGRAYEQVPRNPGFDTLEAFTLIWEEIEDAMDPLFDLRPSSPLDLRAAAPGSTASYYKRPALDGSRPGIFYYLASGSEADLYVMPVVFHHEAIPGHHYQFALTQELDLPLFRRIELPNASTEGWALYAEGLAAELGIYDENPLANLERLKLELFRAARIVVEMGVHYEGWTYDEGASYFARVLGYRTSGMVGIMPRYVGYPGQGSSYTIGALKIRELRQRAMDALGDAFDLREFHNVMLQEGGLPLSIHERLVDQYIERKIAENETAGRSGG